MCFSLQYLSAQNVGQMKGDTLINYVDINKKKQGKWEKKYDNGKIRYKGFFINDVPTGTFMYYHTNGKIKSVLNYAEDTTSTAELYWETGLIAAKGSYDAQNRRIKLWHIYFEDGTLSVIINYKAGQANGAVTMYYPGGKTKILDCNYKLGKLDGMYKKFFQSGLPQEEGPYVNGVKHGHWKLYNPEGFVDEEGEYINGYKEGDWMVYKVGKINDTVNYKMDRPDNYDEMMLEWQQKQEWAKANQDQFKQPENYLDNPIEFFNDRKP